MAERRMFSLKITDSDAFLDMPLSTQALYFHLCMHADDDGFVNNPKRIMRGIGSNTDEMKLLIGKDFVIPFHSGVICITHWKVHNYIAKDRYRPSLLPEKAQVTLDKDSRIYTLDKHCTQAVSNLYTDGTQGVDVVKKSIAKKSIEECSRGEIPKRGDAAQPVHPTEPQTGEVDKEKQTESVTPASKTAKRFKAPTFEEVKAYCTERGNHVDPQRFMNYYQANGWKVGKNGMKDWRAAVRTWERPKDGESSKNTGKIDYARNEGWTL